MSRERMIRMYGAPPSAPAMRSISDLHLVSILHFGMAIALSALALAGPLVMP